MCFSFNKLDDLLGVCQDQLIDVLCLVVTWHDADSVAFNRLRTANYQVVACPRPRTGTSTDLSTNLGGVAVVAAPGINLSTVSVTVVDPTFEFVCAHISTGLFSAIFVLVYRPGSSKIQPVFIEKLSSLFDIVASLQEAVFVVGDFNIHLECSDDPATKQVIDLLCHYGFLLQPTAATHSAGGTLDAVIACDTTDSAQCVDSQLNVSVIDVGLSDHHLLSWPFPSCRVAPEPQTTCLHHWCQLDVDQLREQLRASIICQPDMWPGEIDNMAAMYESELAATAMLDRLIAFRKVTCRRSMVRQRLLGSQAPHSPS